MSKKTFKASASHRPPAKSVKYTYDDRHLYALRIHRRGVSRVSAALWLMDKGRLPMPCTTCNAKVGPGHAFLGAVLEFHPVNNDPEDGAISVLCKACAEPANETITQRVINRRGMAGSA